MCMVFHGLNNRLLQEVAYLFKASTDEITELPQHDNHSWRYHYTYQPPYTQLHQDLIVHITHHNQNTFQEVMAQLDFTLHLSAYGVALAKPCPLPSGRFVEVLAGIIPNTDVKEHFWVKAYTPLPGEPLACLLWHWKDSQAASRTVHQLGKSIGRMHALSQHYLPMPGSVAKHWHDQTPAAVRKQHLPNHNLQGVYQMLETQLAALPRNTVSYGLINGNLCQEAYRIEQDTIYLHDFTWCCYHYYLYDIATVLYEACELELATILGPRYFTPWFMEHFLAGYSSENPSIWSVITQTAYAQNRLDHPASYAQNADILGTLASALQPFIILREFDTYIALSQQPLSHANAQKRTAIAVRLHTHTLPLPLAELNGITAPLVPPSYAPQPVRPPTMAPSPNAAPSAKHGVFIQDEHPYRYP